MRRFEPSHEALLLEGSGGSVPLGFVGEGDKIHLVAREGTARWPVDLLRSGEARLRLADGPHRGVPRLIVEPKERERVLALFLAKYGPKQYRAWYENPRRVLTVEPGPPRTGDQYFGWLQSEFDNIAEDYDHHITDNRMNRLLRDRSLALLGPLFHDSPRLLEIGCGSGMETIPMLRAGHSIVAVDISEKMLDVVRRKAEAAGLGDRFTGVRAKASDLPDLLQKLSGPFDGAYSTYGALNCEPDLRPIAPAIAHLLPPGRRFVAGVYNRWCLFELLGYGMTFQWERALGRRVNPVPVGASRFCVDTYAYSVPEFVGHFRSGFRLERLEGVPVFLPPSDLTSYSEQFGRRFAQLAAMDRTIGGWWPLSTLGDHFLAVLRRLE